jgi:N utilization substance protein B
MSKDMNRHEIRVRALQTLFPLNFNEDLDKKDAIQFALEYDETLVDEEAGVFVPDYLDTLVDGVLTNRADIDALISKHLTDKWTLGRIAKVDLIIMEIAIFEMKYVSEDLVPNKVALNEAINLDKDFSDEKSSKFVNGVLSNVMNEI